MARQTVLHQAIEALETRRLLSGTVGADGTGDGGSGGTATAGTPLDITRLPVFKPTSTVLNDFHNGPLAPAGIALGSMYINYRHAVQSNTAYTNSNPLISMLGSDKVGVTLRIRTNDLSKFVSGLVNAYQFETTGMDGDVVQGYLPVNWIRTIVTRSDVAQMTPIFKPTVSTQGLADNQADKVLKTDAARTAFSADGTGVKVGVISDSVSQVDGGLADSVKTGDLPSNVQVLKDGDIDGFDTDEGRAMLEEIHDVAPGAGLAFSTGEGGQLGFASSVDGLTAAGAKVIVDDLYYVNEPVFQEGRIDAAIRRATAAGASYFTAAGNSANQAYTQAYSTTTIQGKTYVNFNDITNPATQRPVTYLVMTVDEPGILILNWDEPFDGVAGSAKVDLNLYVYRHDNTFRHDDSNLVAAGEDDNTLTGVPQEFAYGLDPSQTYLTAGVYDVQIQLGQPLGPGVSPPTHFKLSTGFGLKIHNWAANDASAFGHSASGAAVSVGAVPWFGVPPYDTDQPILNEDFSSRGGQTYFFNAAGTRLVTPITPQEPVISSIDGVNTSFFNPFGEGPDILADSDTLPNFFGTSAAAPNAAAVAALIKQLAPTATQAQIVSAMTATARPLNGTTRGTWDAVGGFGLIDGNLAIQQFVHAPVASIAAINPAPRGTPVSTVNITFDEAITGLTASDFTLTKNGGANIIGVATLTNPSHDNMTFVLGNLTGLTGAAGTYMLSLGAVSSGVTTFGAAKPLSNSPSVSWQVINPPAIPVKPAAFAVTALSNSSIQLNWTDNNKTETEYTVQRADNASFDHGLKTSHLVADSDTFLSTGLREGQRYYYRVRGTNSTGVGKYTDTAFSLTRIGGEIIMDNSSAGVQVEGYWGSATSGGNFVGQEYLQDGNSAKGTKLVTYDLPIQASGSYYIYAHWTKASNRATNTPFDVFYGPGSLQHTTVLIDQRDRGGDGWTLIAGPLDLEKGTGPSVRIRNAGTNGTVVADAIRLLPAGPLKASSYTPPAPAFATATAHPPTVDIHHDDDLLNIGDALL